MKTKNGFTLRQLGQEYILVAEGLEVINFNRMVSMNTTAAMLWKEIEGKEFDAAKLVDILLDNCDVEKEVAEKDVQNLIESWENAGIIEK